VAVAYLIFFAIIGGQVLLTLFIGVVSESMEEAKADFAQEKVREERLRQRCVKLGIDRKGILVNQYRFSSACLARSSLIGKACARPQMQSAERSPGRSRRSLIKAAAAAATKTTKTTTFICARARSKRAFPPTLPA
jgi:hypothetical protein